MNRTSKERNRAGDNKTMKRQSMRVACRGATDYDANVSVTAAAHETNVQAWLNIRVGEKASGFTNEVHDVYAREEGVEFEALPSVRPDR